MLNARQKLFVDEYLVDLNATRAAKAAGYSPRTAHVCGPRLLSNASVAAAVQAAMAERAAKLNLKKEDVLANVARMASSDVRQVFSPTGKLLDIHKLPDEAALAISSVEVTFNKAGERVTKVKFWDKVKTNEMLMKHLGLLKDGVDLNLSGPVEIHVHKEPPLPAAEKKAADVKPDPDD